MKIPNMKLQFDIYHCKIIHATYHADLRENVPILGHIRSPAPLAQTEPT